MEIAFTPDPELYPFASKWFDSSVGRVHHIDEGDGTPVLFLHGNPTWSFLYRGIITRLRDRFRCVAVDYPGFGLSVRPPGYGYTAEEHARIVGELVDHLSLDGFVVMGQDWGGPIGTRMACDRADRVRGLVLGNTWFWPTDRITNQIFSMAMSSPALQWLIVQRNFFVERMIPMGTSRKLSSPEMDHYRSVQPSPEARKGVAEFPKQLRDAAPFLASLEQDVVSSLSSKPVLLTWGMKDFAFAPGAFLPRMRATFADHRLVELRNAAHFIQEDAPAEIAEAIASHFG